MRPVHSLRVSYSTRAAERRVNRGVDVIEMDTAFARAMRASVEAVS